MGEIMDDRTLLDRYLAKRDEDAFRELVGRHLDFVHAVARRVTGNDELARDAAQLTFMKLAREAARVPRTLSLAAWLHRISRCAAVDLVRTEDRRRKREQLAQRNADTPMNTMPEPEWERLAPVIDEAVDSLPAADRELVLAKYYRNESFAGIAARFGWTEANARKRASRSLEKLRHSLVRRGLTTTAAALATALPLHAMPPAPASLVGKVLAATGEITPAPAIGFHLAMTTAQKTAAAAAAMAFLASGWAGHAVGSSRGIQPTPPPLSSGFTTSEEKDQRTVSTKSSTSRETEDPLIAFRELLEGRRPDPWPVVSRLSVSVIPGLLAEVRESLKGFPPTSAQMMWLMDIEAALLYRWAEDYPRAAFNDVRALMKNQQRGEISRGAPLIQAVVAAWAEKDPDAAYDAVMEDPANYYQTLEAIVRSWTPENLERNLSRHPEQRARLLESYAGVIGGSDGPKREAMLARFQQEPDMPGREHVERRLFLAWGNSDFTTALQRAEALGFTAAVDAIFRQSLSMNPAQAMPAAIERGMVPGAESWERERWTSGCGLWLRMDPAAARAWIERTADLWTGQGNHQAVTDLLSSELTHLRSRLSIDPAAVKETTQRLERSISLWKTADPEAAAQWIERTAPQLGINLDEP